MFVDTSSAFFIGSQDPEQLREGNLDVPTYFNRRGPPSTGTRQLGIVLESPDPHLLIAVRGLSELKGRMPSSLQSPIEMTG